MSSRAQLCREVRGKGALQGLGEQQGAAWRRRVSSRVQQGMEQGRCSRAQESRKEGRAAGCSWAQQSRKKGSSLAQQGKEGGAAEPS